jgi:hypothetical protein
MGRADAHLTYPVEWAPGRLRRIEIVLAWELVPCGAVGNPPPYSWPRQFDFSQHIRPHASAPSKMGIDQGNRVNATSDGWMDDSASERDDGQLQALSLAWPTAAP